MQQYEHWQIELDHRKYGYLILGAPHTAAKPTGDWEEYRQIAVEHATTVLKLNIQKKISNRQVESKYRDVFVQGLLTHQFTNLKEMQAQAAVYH